MTNESAEMMTNKTAIITGGSRGTGRNTGINLAKAGVLLQPSIVFECRVFATGHLGRGQTSGY